MRSTLGPGAELSGRYVIKHQLGRGAMAAVYLAFDQKLNLDVALKVLPGQLAADPTFVARFRREGQTLARLTHPHILRLFDIGEDEATGFYYLVLEYLSSGTLKERVHGVPWEVPAVVDLLRPIASALDYAHGRNPPIVHRDLKPANIMFSDDRVVVSDFGLARLVAPEGGGLDSGETSYATMSAGQILGTPSYMAPEQAEGRPAGPSSDRYALGVVAYELLVGVVPFLADTPQATLIQVATRPLPAPRLRNAALDEEVERVLLKALDRDPDERFSSAEELVAAFSEAAQMTVGVRAATSSLEIKGSPVGAQVVVDGQRRGTLPCTVSALTAGLHTVRVAAPGYEQAERTVSLPRREPLQIDLAPMLDSDLTLALPVRAPSPRESLLQRIVRTPALAIPLALAIPILLAGLLLVRSAASPSEPVISVPEEPVVAASLPVAAPPSADDEWASTLVAIDPVWGADWQVAAQILDTFLGQFPDYSAAREKRHAAVLALGQAWIGEARVDEAIDLLSGEQAAFPGGGEAATLLLALTPTAAPLPTSALPAAAPTVAPTRPPPTAGPAVQPAITPTKAPFAAPE